jgi:hypothetical protein
MNQAFCSKSRTFREVLYEPGSNKDASAGTYGKPLGVDVRREGKVARKREKSGI